jgi:UDP-glucuronate decarboxylase
MKKIRAVVTGGAGFLGSHLCERLLKLDRSIVCVDNFLTGTRDNIVHLFSNPDFSLIEHDICNPFFIEAEEIYNLACPASPIHYQQDPIHTMKTCVIGGINMLEMARKYKAKIFQASTSEVYGDPHVHPQPEAYWGNVNPKGVRSCYDEGKRSAETLFFDYWRMYNIPIKVGRIFNTYGPRMHPNDGRVVSNLIVQALRNEDLTIYGSGNQTRSFCYVDDLIDSFINFMNTPSDILGPINLGNPVEFKIIDLAKIILEITNSSSKIVFKPLPLDDPKQRKPDISNAKKLLNWVPQVALKEGLIATASYFSKKLAKKEINKVSLSHKKK